MSDVEDIGGVAEPGSRGVPQSIVRRHPQFGAILTAEALSAVGDAVFWVGLLVWLLGQDHATTYIALAGVARLAPRVIFGAAGGVLADRYDRRRMLVGLDVARALLMAVLALVVGSDGSSAVVLTVVFASYVLATPYRPALTAGIPFVVGERDAAAANAHDGAVKQTATFLGPLVGTAVLLLGPPAWTFGVNAATFALSAILLSRLTRLGGVPPAARTRRLGTGSSWLHALRDGIEAVAHQSGLTVMMWLVFVFSVARGFELVLLVLVAQSRLGMGAKGVGILNAAIGVGALAVVPLAGRVATTHRLAATVVVSLLLTSIPLALLGVITRPLVACTVLVAIGVGVVVFEVLAVTLIQRLSRLELLGRVFGIENMAVNGGKLVGSLVGPLLVGLFSLEAALVVAAVLVVVSALAAVPALARVGRAALARRHELEPVVQVLATLALFDGASQPALERLATSAQSIAVVEGTDVVTEGDVPDCLYVIRSGRFEVVKHATTLAILNHDDWFGEIGILENIPRTATVRAATDGELWQIQGAEFLAAVTESALPAAALLEGISARLAELSEIPDPSAGGETPPTDSR